MHLHPMHASLGKERCASSLLLLNCFFFFLFFFVVHPRQSQWMPRLTAEGLRGQSQFANMKPVSDRVVIKVVEAEEETKSGIVLPAAATQHPTAGVVQAAPQKEGVSVKEGEYALYSNFAGTDFKVEEDNIVILRDGDVLGTLPSPRADISELEPAHDRLLVKAIDPPKETRAGLIVSSESLDPPTVGHVKAKGPGKKGQDDSLDAIPLGQAVLYSRWAGQEYEGEDGAKWLVLRASDIEALLD